MKSKIVALAELLRGVKEYFQAKCMIPDHRILNQIFSGIFGFF